MTVPSARRLREAVETWELAVDGPSVHGRTAITVPVVDAGEPAMLRVGRHPGGAHHAALALRHWDGEGAVRLLRADPGRNVLVLERLRSVDLRSIGDVEACEIVAGLYRSLHRPAPVRLPRLSTIVGEWTDALATMPRGAPLPRRLIEQAVHLGRALAKDPGTDGTLVHGDLRGGNVLAADRAPWLAIDPQPLSGDPCFELQPMLRDRWTEVVARGDVRRVIRRRFHTLVDVAGLDQGRARDWAVVLSARDAMRAAQDGDAEALTAAVATWKAVQD